MEQIQILLIRIVGQAAAQLLAVEQPEQVQPQLPEELAAQRPLPMSTTESSGTDTNTTSNSTGQALPGNINVTIDPNQPGVDVNGSNPDVHVNVNATHPGASVNGVNAGL